MGYVQIRCLSHDLRATLVHFHVVHSLAVVLMEDNSAASPKYSYYLW